MYEITKRFEFAASHQLDHLPEEHKCHRLHGHNYEVEVRLEGDLLDSNGFVVDYGDLSDLKWHIDNVIDHRHLNEVLGSGYATTAENLARYFYTCCQHYPWGSLVTAVTVKETPKTSATYLP